MIARGAWMALLLLAAPSARAQPLTVERAVELAFERNPELASLAAEARAAQGRAEAAGRWLSENPEVFAAAGPRSLSGERSVDLEVGLSQRLEVFGERSARRNAAAAEHQAAQSRMAARRVELAADVRSAFARALATRELLELAREELSLARATAQAVARRVEAGKASPLELAAVRAAIGQAALQLSDAQREAEDARARLALLLAADEPLELAPSPWPPPERLEALAESELARRALDQRPDRAAARRELEAAQAEQRLASRAALPAPELGARYVREEGATILMGTVALPVPLFDRNQVARSEAAAREARARAEMAQTERRIRLEVQRAHARHASARQTLRIIEEEGLGDAEQSARDADRAYEAGKIGLTDLLASRRAALEARRGLIEARAALHEAEAELARAMGSETLVARPAS